YALAKAFDFAQQIRKTPIVVNDSPGFFTTRVFTTFVDEGIRLLEEGIHPARIENLARMTGMPVGPLAVSDEVSQKLIVTIAETQHEHKNHASLRVAKRLIDEFHRGGRAYGGGFYDYPEDAPKHLWAKLISLYYDPKVLIDDHDIQERLLFRQVIEALRCYEEGVLNSVIDANIGSIYGIGFPAQTGGVLQFIKAYGETAFLERAIELAKRYGVRFTPPSTIP
ncbi:MAG: 3-hydroxyacyl-CoA dehydrogenase family protein, partial [Pseudomonadota bacterium]|nr:3-hydroxyacyl-CoA dehydrogenase family protein [Pseudomonadota bacterium]